MNTSNPNSPEDPDFDRTEKCSNLIQSKGWHCCIYNTGMWEIRSPDEEEHGIISDKLMMRLAGTL